MITRKKQRLTDLACFIAAMGIHAAILWGVTLPSERAAEQMVYEDVELAEAPPPPPPEQLEVMEPEGLIQDTEFTALTPLPMPEIAAPAAPPPDLSSAPAFDSLSVDDMVFSYSSDFTSMTSAALRGVDGNYFFGASRGRGGSPGANANNAAESAQGWSEESLGDELGSGGVRCEFCPPPEYPKAARQRGLEGKVYLRLAIDERGQVIDATVSQSSGFEPLDDAAIRTVKRWRVQPRIINEVAVKTIAKQAISFDLADVN